jgi:hypothetical protein
MATSSSGRNAQITSPMDWAEAETCAIQSGGPERGSVSRSTSPAYGHAAVLEKLLRVTDQLCSAWILR